MKHLCRFVIFLIVFSCSKSEINDEPLIPEKITCPPEEVDVENDIEANRYKTNYFSCKHVQQNITIRNEVKNIDGFSNIDKITGDLKIYNTKELNSIIAFDNLKTINGNLIIESNVALGSLSFKNLEFVQGNILIKQNIALNKIIFDNLTEVSGKIIIEGNANLLLIDGFQKISKAGGIEIHAYQSLKEITGFSNLKEVTGTFDLSGNQLINCSGFFNLEKVGQNFFLHASNLNLENSFNKLTEASSMNISNGRLDLNISGFNLLTKTESISFTSVFSKKIIGFNNLTHLGTLTIAYNPNLEMTDGFDKLESLNSLLVHNNSTLGSFKLNSVQFLKRTYIHDNSILNIIEFPEVKSSIELLDIGENKNLTKITGFENVITLLDLRISNNSSLITIPSFNSVKNGGVLSIDINGLGIYTGFNSIEKIESLKFNSKQLTSLSGFNQLKEIGFFGCNLSNIANLDSFKNLKIATTLQLFMPKLEKFSSFNELTTAESLEIVGTNSMTDLKSFNKLTNIKYLSISNNESLESISGFQLLKSLNRLQIQGNINLTSIEGFNNVDNISDEINIRYNKKLSNCNIKFLCNVSPSFIASHHIEYNAEGCLNIDEIKESCK